MEAKTFARDALYRELEARGIDPKNCEVLDVGHEPYYAHLFHRIKAANLPDFDMHDLPPQQSDAILAMHVLEHSPFPLLALLSMKRALMPLGVIYVAVPVVDHPFLTDPCHFSVLRPEQWEKIFADAGLRIVERKPDGKFNTYATAWEHRYILA